MQKIDDKYSEGIIHWYISDVRRMTNAKDNAIFDYLEIRFPSKDEESFTVDFNAGGTYDRIDCSNKSPVLYFKNESGEWETSYEQEYKSFEEFKSSDDFDEKKGIEYNLETLEKNDS